MIFYKITDEKNKVGKTLTAGTSLTLYGQFETEISITAPSFIIQYDAVDIFSWNYVYIPQLKRYYFIDDITAVRKGVFRIICSVDVLESFGADLKLLPAFVTRNESVQDTSLADNRLPLKSIREIAFEVPTRGSLYNTTFDTDWGDDTDDIDNSHTPYIVNVFNEDVSDPLSHAYGHPTRNDPPAIDGTPLSLPAVTTCVFGNTQTFSYLFNIWFEKYLEKFIYVESSYATYVMSVVAFPFNCDFLCDLDSSDQPEKVRPKINDKYLFSTPTNTTLLTSKRNTGYIITEDFKITSPYSSNFKFLNYEPYNVYEFFVPYYGWVKMNPIDILDKRLILYYIADVYTGMATAFIYNVTDEKLVWSAPCQLGVVIPINTTNNEEITARKQANTNNLILGLVGSAISVGIGGLSGNPVAIAGGVLSGSKAIASAVNNEMMMFETARASFGDSNSALYSGQRLVIKRTYIAPTSNVDSSKYAHLQGYPYNAYVSLSGLSGYTEIGEIHYKPTNQTHITGKEIDLIESLAKTGIIL